MLATLACIGVASHPVVAAEPVWSEPARYPEGPMVRDVDVYWAEMRADAVRRRTGGVVTTVFKEPGCGPTSVKPAGARSLWVLCHLSDQVLRVDPDGAVELRLRRARGGLRLRNPNDAAPDGLGGVFVSLSGRFALRARSTGRVVHISSAGVVRSVIRGLRYANGLAFDPETKQLLVSEHLARKVWRLQLSDELALQSKELFLDLDALPISDASYPLAGPDGIVALPGGQYLVAEYGASRLIQVTAAGEFVAVVDAPAPFVTNAVLVANTLAITATSINDAEPYTGSVTAIAWPRELVSSE